MSIYCEVCGKEKERNRRKTCSKECLQEFQRKRCKESSFGGRKKGQKNISPYPITEAVLIARKNNANSPNHLGKKVSEETKAKISKANKGKIRSQEAIEKMKLAQQNRKPVSEETRKKLSKISLGRILSDSHKEKLRLSNIGKHRSKEVIEKHRQSMIGRKLSEQHKEKISKGLIKAIENGFMPKNNRSRRCSTGLYHCKNPNKYLGDPTRICYRSLWELKMMMHLDSNPNVIKWQSEEISLGYLDKATGRVRRYFPDFVVVFKHEDGSTRTVMVEIKPLSQTTPPRKNRRTTPKSEQRYLSETMLYATNVSKWEAAKIYCSKRGWEFQLLTENEIFFKPKEL